MDRTQRWLAWGLGIQIVLLAILHPPFARRTASASEPLLPALASLAPRMLEIAAADGGSVTLVRGSGGWGPRNPPGLPGARRQVESAPPDAPGSPRGPARREQPPLARRAQGRGRRVRAPPPR